jgi:hypothetical protein
MLILKSLKISFYLQTPIMKIVWCLKVIFSSNLLYIRKNNKMYYPKKISRLFKTLSSNLQQEIFSKLDQFKQIRLNSMKIKIIE